MSLRSLIAGVFGSSSSPASGPWRGKPLYDQPFVAFTEFDRDALGELIERVSPTGARMLEIGSWLGNSSTRTFAEHLIPHSGVLYCIDTWKGSLNVERHQKIVRDFDVFSTFLRNIEAYGGNGVIRPIMMTSKEAAEIFPDRFLDLVFIDGDHSRDAVREDICLWSPKVRHGGILCGHDCEMRAHRLGRDRLHGSRHLDTIDGPAPFARIHPGPILAVDELLGEKAVLFAEEERTLPGGASGYSSIWYREMD